MKHGEPKQFTTFNKTARKGVNTLDNDKIKKLAEDARLAQGNLNNAVRELTEAGLVVKINTVEVISGSEFIKDVEIIKQERY